MICKNYKKISKIGEGSYGKVYHAINTINKSEVAIKEMKNIEGYSDQGIPYTTLREISLLREISHNNVVKLIEIIHEEDNCIFVVFEYIQSDLKKYLRTYCDLDFQKLKYIFRQIIVAVDYIHSNGIIHRDLKTNNILINPGDLNIKIADFGLARTFNVPFRIYSKDIGTLYYRAPEVIMGSYYYGLGYDIWSLGVILVELFFRFPFIKGESQTDQLFKIFQVLGKPNKEIWHNVDKISDFSTNFPNTKPIGIRKYLKCLNENIYNKLNDSYFTLLEEMLNLNPNKRILCYDILKHPFLAN